MRRRHLHTVVVTVLLALAATASPLAGGTRNPCADGGPARPDEGGIGGTGARPAGDEGGIGGTGSRPGSDEGGIGGTGFTGRGPVGVIGTITGFGSICVGPTEVHYGADTPVVVDGHTVDASTLALGQVVELVADGANGELRARAVAVTHVVQGPITRVGDAGDQIEVMGQLVLGPRGAGATWLLQGEWPVGTVVQVSGMRRADGAIVASRIGRLDATDVVTLTGPWRDGTIGATRVEASAATTGAIPSGTEVRVSGRWDGATIRATSVEVLPALPFAGRVARVALEGFARPAADGTLRVGSFAVTGVATRDLAALDDVRIRVEALVRDHTLVVERAARVELPLVRPSRTDGGGGAADHGPDGGGPGHGPGDAGRPDGGPGRNVVAPPRPAGGPTRPDGGARPDRPDRPDQPQRPDRPERPAPPDRPDVPRPERPNHAGPPPRPDMPPR